MTDKTAVQTADEAVDIAALDAARARFRYHSALQAMGPAGQGVSSTDIAVEFARSKVDLAVSATALHRAKQAASNARAVAATKAHDMGIDR